MGRKDRQNRTVNTAEVANATDENNLIEDASDKETVEPMPIDKLENIVIEMHKSDIEPELDNSLDYLTDEEIDQLAADAASKETAEDKTEDKVEEPETEETEPEDKVEEPEYNVFSKENVIAILDSEVEIDASKATIYYTEDDMIAAAKLEKLYKLSIKLGSNTPVARVLSQTLKYASTSADKRKGDMLFGTLMREINGSTPGKDFELLMFVVTKTFKALKTLSETAIVRSFREVKNVEVKQSSLLLSHLISQLATADDRKKKIGVTISLDRAVQVSSNGLNQNGANLVKDYFKK